MKTPEQIAADLTGRIRAKAREEFGAEPLYVPMPNLPRIIAGAIEADRAQREKNTLIIHLDEEWDAISAMREVHAWLERGDYTMGYEPEWKLHDSYDREGEGE